MTSPGFLNTEHSGSWDDFPGSPTEIWQDFSQLRLAFPASPEQLTEPLPDLDASSISTQPSPIYLSPHEAPPHPNSHTPFNFHGQPHQYYTPPSFNRQDSGSVPAVMPTTQQPSMALNVGHSLMYNDLQGYSSVISPSPVHDAFYYPPDHSAFAQSHYNDSQVFVDQTIPSHSAMRAHSQQIQPAPAGVVQSSSVPPALAFQPMVSRFLPAQVPPICRNSRRNRSVPSSPYHSTRTSSLPVQSASPTEPAIHTCRWTRDDGTTCGAQITPASVPQHLTTHGVKNLAHDHRLPCRWLGCRLRGDKDKMKRESLVRHIREKHLRCKRTSN